MWLPCPGSGRRPHNGEVWTSPRIESPRLPGRNQPPGGTSSPKADGLYKRCWRIAAPHGATLGPWLRPTGRKVGQRSRGHLARLPAPGRCAKGGPGVKGPPMLQQPPPDSWMDTPEKKNGPINRTEKNSLFKTKRSGKRAGPVGVLEHRAVPPGRGKTRLCRVCPPPPSLTPEMWKKLWKTRICGIIYSVRGQKVQDSCENLQCKGE